MCTAPPPIPFFDVNCKENQHELSKRGFIGYLWHKPDDLHPFQFELRNTIRRAYYRDCPHTGKLKVHVSNTEEVCLRFYDIPDFDECLRLALETVDKQQIPAVIFIDETKPNPQMGNQLI